MKQSELKQLYREEIQTKLTWELILGYPLFFIWIILGIIVVLSSCSTTQPYSNLQITYPQLHNHLEDTVCVYIEETTVTYNITDFVNQ